MTGSDDAGRRRLALAVFAALLAAGTLTGSLLRALPAAAPSVPAMPTVTPAALTSSWYCAGATGKPGGAADGSLVIANTGATPVTGAVTVVPNDGKPASRPVQVGPWSRGVVHEGDVAAGSFVGATVVLHGGTAVVDQEVSGPLGTSAVPCASRPYDRWYFPSGTTADGTSMLIGLYNPFPQDAIADLSFATDQGPSAPAPFQGLYVPAGNLLMVDVGQHVLNRAVVATAVKVRVGRLVATKLQIDTRKGRTGSTLVLGAPRPLARWYFPDGLVAPGVTETYALYNPTGTDSRVALDINLSQGGAEPIVTDVPAGSVVMVAANGQPRIPLGDPHSVVVRTITGPGVVAERTVSAGPPSTRRGLGELVGSAQTASRWVLAAGSTDPSVDEWLVVLNPGRRPVEVSVASLGDGQRLPVDGLQGVVVPAGGRSAFRLGDHVSRSELSLAVDGSGPVVAERDIYQVTGVGLALSVGVPVGGLGEG